MPDNVVGTQAGAGTAGTGAGAPAQAAPQATPPAAAPPGPQAGRPATAGAGVTPGSPDVDTGDARVQRWLTTRGREAAEAREALVQAEKYFGPRTEWERRAAAAGTPPDGARPAGPPPSPVGVGVAPAADPQVAARWGNWANGEFSTYLNGVTYQEQGEDGQPVLKRIAPDMGAARDFAQRMDGVLRGMGITPPWDGMYQFGSDRNAQPPNPTGEDKPLTVRDYQQLRQQEAKHDFRAGREFDRAMRSLGSDLRLAPSFFQEQVDVALPDGSGTEKVSRADAIEAYCVEHGVSPRQAVMECHQGDMVSQWRKDAYAGGQADREADQQGLMTPGAVRVRTFPETQADQQKLAAYDAVNQRVGESSFGGEPKNAPPVIYDDGQDRPR